MAFGEQKQVHFTQHFAIWNRLCSVGSWADEDKRERPGGIH